MTDIINRNVADELVDEVSEATVEVTPRRKDKPWQRWIDAELGLRNHWYPAHRSIDLRDGESKAIKILGEDIFITRQKGAAKAVEDRCRHRGVRFSERPIHYTDETITCWYHTWTYDLDDGKLVAVLNDQTCSHIGRIGIKSYPIREVNGLIFIFIGDIDPPDLRLDVPPGFLDGDTACYVSEPTVVKANWRLGCENGFDPGHHYIHNWSPWTLAVGLPMSFGWVSTRDSLKRVSIYEDAEDSPKGFTRIGAETTMNQEADIPLRDGGAVRVQTPGMDGRTMEDLAAVMAGSHVDQVTVGLWLPNGLKVTAWPKPGIHHYEFYVPQDENTHLYIQCGQKLNVTDQAERDRWEKTDGYFQWKVPVVDSFTTADVMAREGLQKFYSEEDGWHNERLFQPDMEITMWRNFAGKHARGTQTKTHAKGNFPRPVNTGTGETAGTGEK